MDIKIEYVLTALSILFTFIAVVISYYQYVKKIIEQNALDSINKVEDLDKAGEEKLADAVELVYAMVPAVVKPFISKKMIEVTIQTVFDKVQEFAQKQVDKEVSEQE